MPKEYIRSMDFSKEFKSIGGDAIKYVDHEAAKVSWSRDGGHLSLVVTNMADDPDAMNGEHHHLNLDRRGANDLIRVLRRARDGAFGADA